MRRLAPVVFASIFLAGPIAFSQTRTFSYYFEPPRPTGSVVIDNPVIEFPIWSEESLTFTVATATLNGSPVQATYDAAARSARFLNGDHLQPGVYKAEITVMINGRHPVKRSWSFTVEPPRTTRTVDPIAFQPIANEINRLRRLHGLEPIATDSRLVSAASEHIRYMASNNRLSHEQSSPTNFFGADLRTRTNRFGFYGSATEVIGRAPGSKTTVLRKLFDAPYHRIGFLRPGRISVGGAFDTPYACIIFGAPLDSRVVVSPGDGMSDVPSSWINNETPDPLRKAALGNLVGYPIVIADFQTETSAADLLVVSSSIRDSGGSEVQHIVNDSSNDRFATNAAILVPVDPLKKQERYTVEVEFVGSGRRHHRVWSFTTAAH